MEAVSAGPTLELVDNCDGEEEDLEDGGNSINIGDRIFATGLLPSPAHIQATSSISQQLAEAFRLNSEASAQPGSIPDYLKEFDSVFSKKSFDALPKSKKWEVFTLPHTFRSDSIRLLFGWNTSNFSNQSLIESDRTLRLVLLIVVTITFN